MADLVFPYPEWDVAKDSLPFHQSTPRAFGVVDDAVEIGSVPVTLNSKRAKHVKPVVDEVTALLMECIEWLRERGVESIRSSRILKEMRERDARDQNRAVAPLRPAEGAVTIDTTELDADAAFEAAMNIIRSQRPFLDKG